MTIILFLVWVSIILCLCALQYNLNRRRLVKFAEEIPGPTGYPLLGMLPRFFGKSNEEILAEVMDIVNSYENIARFWLGNKLILLFTSADYVKTVLNSDKCLDKAFAYEFLGVSFGLIASKCEFSKKK